MPLGHVTYCLEITWKISGLGMSKCKSFSQERLFPAARVWFRMCGLTWVKSQDVPHF